MASPTPIILLSEKLKFENLKIENPVFVNGNREYLKNIQKLNILFFE
jgi:hypothetical protein